MSIVALQKVTFVGHVDQRKQVLEDLQTLGCLQIIPLAVEGDSTEDRGPTPRARQALEFLLTCPDKRRQVKDARRFDGETVERQSLDLRDRKDALREERDFLSTRIADLEPWGDFEHAPLGELAGHRLWFYVVPHIQMKAVPATDLRWEEVFHDHRFSYVVVVAEGDEEPEGMPVPRTHTGARPRHELQERLEDVEMELEDAAAERESLTRWIELFARDLDHLEDLAARRHAEGQTLSNEPVFALQAWAPTARMDELRTFAADQGLALEVRDPDPDEQPPTLLKNPESIAGGEYLVSFYMTPGYRMWDPSSVVFVSFAIFFGMILADVGYAVLLGLIVACYWKKLAHTEVGRRWRVILSSLVGMTLVYGVLVGSYFGVTPSDDTLLGRLRVLDLNDSGTMMALSIVIGAVHVALGCLMDAYRNRRSPAALAPLGWMGMLLGGLVAAGGNQYGVDAAIDVGIGAAIAGAVLVFLFTGHGSSLGGRLVKGLMAFTNVTTAFGDVMSYLRLFALGLASGSLAVAFNNMAGQVNDALPGIGIFFALLVLIIGHAMNFTLSLSSAVIHGLRLNVIEFFKWGVKEEGTPYRIFERKEQPSWTRTS